MAVFMASPTKKLKVRRSLKKASAAKRRKNRNRNYGSTAKLLPLNKPNAMEKSVHAAK
tara:strand:+ start:3360 stop:3533 length:174 start_codon:yes stop_codon:yes gene_type:complete